MLGVASGDEILNIITECLAYQPTNALNLFHRLYETGFDCYLFAKELLRTTEWLVRLKFTPDIVNDASLNEVFVAKSTDIATKTDVHLLSRMWDIALKATQDIKIAPDSKAVCEMALIRMNYGLALPDPAMMYQKIIASHDTVAVTEHLSDTEKKNSNATTIITPQTKKNIAITKLQDISDILSENRLLDLVRLLEVKAIIHDFKQGYIELSNAPTYNIDTKDIQSLKVVLEKLTDYVWVIDFKTRIDNDTSINKSIYETKKEHKSNLIEEAQNDKIVKIILDNLKGAKVIQVTQAIALPLDTDLLESNSNNTEIEEE
jgi:DNA polymerase III gamma/tau subunit